MNNIYSFLTSEIHELENLLEMIPEENIIDRMSLISRIAIVKESLAQTKQYGEMPMARLTFRGEPVFESHGISAYFGAKATELFSDVFTVVAADLNGILRENGPIPEKDKNQLLITGTAIGSFGFEFELPRSSEQQASLFPKSDLSVEAMKKIEALFRLTAEGTDDEITETIAEIQPRTVRKIYEFLDLLVQQGAWCGLEFGDKSFRYKDYEQIKFAASRIKDDNIHQLEEQYRGEFQGVLPTGRTFEFKPSDPKDALICGKVDRSIDDPDILNREWLHSQISIKLKAMQVGHGRPSHTLMSLEDLRK
jgi:hypothetical protein